MGPTIHLIAHNAVTTASILFSLGYILFLMSQRPLKTVHWTLALTFAFVVVFEVSHMIGVNVSDPLLSRDILMWNLSVIAISVVNFHCVMAALGLDREKRTLIASIYALGAAFIGFYLLFPDAFLLASTPKMYFPEYYVPGKLYLLSRLVFQGAIPVYFIYLLIHTYRRTADFVEKNRLLYFAAALFLGWGFGAVPPLLIFDIPVDPLYGMLFPIFFGIPFIYAVLHYDLLDIRIIAKRAFLYGISITVVGGLLTLFNASSQFIQASYPGFPEWVMPMISALIAVGIGVVVWRQLRQGDVLKYEFITTVTHKFRTPLTHIKWAGENLSKMALPEEAKEQLGYISSANTKLVELTDVLAQTSDSDSGYFRYKVSEDDLSALATETAGHSQEHAAAAGIAIRTEIEPGVRASFDAGRIGFVMQTLIDNAIDYSPAGGSVTISAKADGGDAVFSVKDGGIGIAKDELPLLFSKLYRGKRARSTDTEGMGIGLYISKDIIAKHGGRIWAESEGEGKGSVFSFSLRRAV
ncbi:MAG: HAMP domain-containing histidine kinase [Patescibacteria group bacterium]|nr:HAMP domain-containing histidine kinase [Patescibacteria group bacterium]